MGGGGLLIPRATSGGGEGRPQAEAMREEVHRFDQTDYTTGTRISSDDSLQVCYVLHAQRAIHGYFLGSEPASG
jgi:hypothetical protein